MCGRGEDRLQVSSVAGRSVGLGGVTVREEGWQRITSRLRGKGRGGRVGGPPAVRPPPSLARCLLCILAIVSTAFADSAPSDPESDGKVVLVPGKEAEAELESLDDLGLGNGAEAEGHADRQDDGVWC